MFSKRFGPQLRRLLRPRPPSRESCTGEGPADEWEFLRSQPDHDAEEMSNVRRAGPAPEAPRNLEPERRRRAGPWSMAAAALAALPLRYEGWRDRFHPARPPADPAAAPGAGGSALRTVAAGEEHFAPGADAGVPADEPPSRVDPTPGLALRVRCAGQEWIHRVTGETLLGRRILPHARIPEVNLSGDERVAPEHARITHAAPLYLLCDLGARGGTRLNGDLLRPDVVVPLGPGDLIELGACTAIDVIEAPADPELTSEDLMLAELLHGAIAPQEAPAAPLPSQSAAQQRRGCAQS
jgi:hypothetical protein